MAKRRTRIGEGIYRDKYGLAACVKVGNVQRERRFPFDAPDEEIKHWQAQVRAQLWEDQRHEPAPIPGEATPRGTLAADIAKYAKLIVGRPSYASERAHLRAWEPLYGTKRRAFLRPEDVASAVAQWTAAGAAPQTVIHRCRVLRQLYHALDGPTARTPVDHVARPSKPKPRPVTVPIEIIASALQKLERADPVYAARFRVLATTGQRPSQLMRTTPTDVSLKRGIWMVPAAKKGDVRELYLNPDMKAAWKVFIQREAWGEYDTTRMARLLRRCGWPEGVRPYNVRHSFAVAALEMGIDLGDVQGMLGHTEIDTTRKFYAPILQERLKVASQRMAGRLPAKSASGTASRRPPVRSISRQTRGVRSKAGRR
jgi:integrase